MTKLFISFVLTTIAVIVDPAQPPLPGDGGFKTGEVALTFDDGPDPVVTPKILKILKKHGMKATFFEVGLAAAQHPEITKQILQQGHSLGSHSWDHQDLTQLPFQEALDNINRGHAAVEAAAGGKFHTPFFRFPYFYSTPELKAALKARGLVPFDASLVTEDWMTPDPKELLAKALAMVDGEKRGIILFHDVQPQTAEMLDEFLTQLTARGYKTAVFRVYKSCNSSVSAGASRGVSSVDSHE